MLKKTLEKKQANLLLKIVPFLRNVMCFAFNGGTVINFFCSDTFKRYSVDLDGVFIPPKEIKNVSKETITSLANKELSKLKNELESPSNKRMLGIVRIDHLRKKRLLRIHAYAPTSKNDIIKVKLEVHGTYTCTTEDVVIRRLGKAAREEFNTDCEIRSVNDAKLYSVKFIAFLARNSVKDGYDMDHLFKEGINFGKYKESMLFNLLGSTQSVVRILDFNVNKLPNDYHDQYQTLDASDYSKEKHINTMKRSKSIFLSMLTEQDCYYILASALGRLHETDYAFNHMPSVKARNKSNKTEVRTKNYRLKTVNLFKSLPYAKMTWHLLKNIWTN